MPPISYLFACEWCLRHFRQWARVLRFGRRWMPRQADDSDDAGDAAGRDSPSHGSNVHDPSLPMEADTTQGSEALGAPESASDEEGDEHSDEDSDDSVDESGSDEDSSDDEDSGFDTLLEIYRFIVGCNGGRGLSDKGVAWLCKMLRDPRFDPSEVPRWRSRNAANKYGLALLTAQREYVKKELRIEGYDHTFEVLCTEPVAAVLELFGHPDNAEGFQLFAQTVNSGAGRIYNTPASATFWEEAQVCASAESVSSHPLAVPLMLVSWLPRCVSDESTCYTFCMQDWLNILFGEGQVVAPVIISSDATVLSGNDRIKVWAVYISLANIALRRRWLDTGRVLLALLPMPPSDMTGEQKMQLF
ncbi:unnamed protein product [Closterium sp. Naga37s-1]|nr:unnamed protein product [Closterium sp. Naga37s-1]